MRAGQSLVGRNFRLRSGKPRHYPSPILRSSWRPGNPNASFAGIWGNLATALYICRNLQVEHLKQLQSHADLRAATWKSSVTHVLVHLSTACVQMPTNGYFRFPVFLLPNINLDLALVAQTPYALQFAVI